MRIAAAETLALYAPNENTRNLAIATLIENADARKAGAYHVVAALNALEHLPSLSKADKELIAALPKTSDTDPGRANGYAARMHEHIANPIPD